MEFFEKTGKMAIGSRVRLLAETITGDAAQLYQAYGFDLQPRWFPVLYYLSDHDSETITGIARAIGHSHPSVSKLIGELTAAGYVTGKPDRVDARRNRVKLSRRGKEVMEKMQDQFADVAAAVDEISAQSRHDLWQAMQEWENLLREKSLLQRVLERKWKRENSRIRIVAYKPAYRKAFRDLNVEWISKYFTMEASDYKALDKPEEYILTPGGHILIAVEDTMAIGSCALIKMHNSEYDFELAKMAVSPAKRGRGVGEMLGRAAIDKARAVVARKIYLESNSVLEPALALYKKLGFKKVTGKPTPYQRCDIQMELEMDNSN